MKVPFSPTNLEQKPIPHNIFITAGPAAINDIVNLISSSEDQGWTTRAVVFSGMVQVSVIRTAQPQMVPVYTALICKVFNEGDEMVNPAIKDLKVNDVSQG